VVARRSSACLATICLLVVSGCAGGSPSSLPGTSSPAGSSSSSAAKATEIVVSVKDGKVSPKAHRVRAAEGSRVQILVSSDVDDEVHVHGYDIEREVSAGQSTTIVFTANQTGVFEVETHESNLLLLQLQVQ
jgi:heme/copper-type cytochrome/quinol oxidase subunit 2